MTDIFIIKTNNGAVTTELFMKFPAPIAFLQSRLEEYEVSRRCWYELERKVHQAYEFVLKLDDIYFENTDGVYFGLRPGNVDLYLNNPAGHC